MLTHVQTYLDRRSHRMNLQVQSFLNRRVILVVSYTSNKTVNHLLMHDDSFDAQIGHHRLLTATVQDFDQKP